jgi:hypothetical protein
VPLDQTPLPQRPVTAPQHPNGDERIRDSMRHDCVPDPAAPLLGRGIQQVSDSSGNPAIVMQETKRDRRMTSAAGLTDSKSAEMRRRSRKPRKTNSSAMGTVMTAARIRKTSHVMRTTTGEAVKAQRHTNFNARSCESIQRNPEGEDQATDHRNRPPKSAIDACVVAPEEQQRTGGRHESQRIHPFETPRSCARDDRRRENGQERSEIGVRGCFSTVNQRRKTPPLGKPGHSVRHGRKPEGDTIEWDPN